MRNILDLVLTLFVLLLVWVVPRLALESRRRKQRAAQRTAQNGAQKAPARATPGVVNAGAVTPGAVPEAAAAASREDLYDWDEKAAESWLERQRGAEAGPPEARTLPPPAAVPREETRMENPDYYSSEEAPAVGIPAGQLRRRALRRAVLWKEILDQPKGLHPNPFG